MMTFTPLWNTLITSSVWQTDKETRLVWITMLAMKDSNGKVEGSIPGLANLAGVAVEECRASLALLASPDRDSRTQEHEGRRIKAVDGGWMVLNHEKYRNLMADRREYWRNKQKERRQKIRNQPQARERLAVAEGAE
jgi:hypothetical protein